MYSYLQILCNSCIYEDKIVNANAAGLLLKPSSDNRPLFSTGHESSRRKVISVKILQSNILPTVGARGVVVEEGKEQR